MAEKPSSAACSRASGIVQVVRASADELPRIASRYLMVIHIPLYRDQQQRRYAEPLWFKDLQEHLAYLDNFTLACPCVDGTPPAGAVPLDSDPRFLRVQFIDLPPSRSLAQAVRHLPATVSSLWRAVRTTEIVQSGVAGWPIPTGWIISPLARILKKHSVIVVESAPWRLQRGLPANLKSRLRASVYERLARWCLEHTDLAIFTQEEYRQSLIVGQKRGHVIHASWIDADVILSDSSADAIWQEKLSEDLGELRVLFAGQLSVAKGVLVLLEAIGLVGNSNLPVKLDILGAGDLAAKCAQVSATLHGSTRAQLLGTVNYGAPLFRLLRQYHAVVIPSISDEQPRIVYDAYSQAVPVLASSTAGLRDCIREQQTGWLVTANDPRALSGMLERALRHKEELRRMGMEAVRLARTMTHQQMHRERQRLLLQFLDQRGA
jgi:glycosyltransferase involved in cell wall biosynthesis